MKGLAVDIDCTLSNTNIYWIKKLEAKFGKVGNLTSIEILEKYVYASKVPDWQGAEALEYMTYLREDSDEQYNLPLIKEADKWVRKINEIIPIKAYLTSRPMKVISGTKRWLKKYKFPEAKVISRPNNILHEDGNKWKACKIKALYPGIIGIIDDNPYFIDFIEDGYKGVIFLYKNCYEDKKDFKIISCSDWRGVFLKVNKFVRIYKKKND